MRTTEDLKTKCNEEWKGMVTYASMPPMPSMVLAGVKTSSDCHANNTYVAPACYYNDASGPILAKNSMHELNDVAGLFDGVGCGPTIGNTEGGNDFAMAGQGDASMPWLMMPASENVKREMDLLEMISQSNICHGSI